MGFENIVRDVVFVSTLISTFVWCIILLLPWRPWGVRESLDSADDYETADLSDITVLIPARNEAENIGSTLKALHQQGNGLTVIMIDDQSSDQTASLARLCQIPRLTIVEGGPLPEGWSGKLWALQQGLQHVNTPSVLLLDADISLHPGILATLKNKKHNENLQMISLMARLPMRGFWEKLLLPAFVYFFKLLYPFSLINNHHPRWQKAAAAAGGCILIDRQVLIDLGAFDSLRDALIDDCTLARKVKQQGNRIWLGLSHSLDSCRRDHSLSDIWNMVARTAFTQLHYAWWLLMLVTVIMFVMYVAPLGGLFYASPVTQILALLSISIMFLCYIPTLRYYQLSPFWSILMPLIATLFLAMSWSSAIAYARGERSQWKERVYSKTLTTTSRRKTGQCE